MNVHRVDNLSFVSVLLLLLALLASGCDDDDDPAHPGPGDTPATPQASDWVWSNPTPQGNSLLGIDFYADGRALAVGSNGTIIRTRDGGATWDLQTEVIDGSLRAVQHVGGTTAIAVGSGGRAVKSTDEGRSWNPITTGTNDDVVLLDLHFWDDRTGVVLGSDGVLLRTTDGGGSWTRIQAAPSSLFGMHAVDREFMVAVGPDGTVTRSLDGGISWTRLPTSLDDDDLIGVVFWDHQIGLVLSRHRIRRTTDGGVTWQEVFRDDDIEMTAICRTAGDNAFVVSRDSNRDRKPWLLMSTDRGVSWIGSPYEGEKGLLAVSSAPSGDVMAVGYEGLIFASAPGDPSVWWQISGGRGMSSAADVTFVDATWGYMLVRNAIGGRVVSDIARTSDGGRTWEFPADWSESYIRGFAFRDRNLGVAVRSGGVMRATTDGGRTWHDLAEVGGSDLVDIAYMSSTRIVAVGDAIVVSNDGGTSWQATSVDAELSSVFVVDEQTAMAVGAQGTVMRTVDGGATWEEFRTGDPSLLRAGHFFSSERGVVVGVDGIWTTEDGCRTWTLRATPIDELHDVDFHGDLFGTAVGSTVVGHGIIGVLTTFDGGATWEPEALVHSGSLYSIEFLPDGTRVVAGSSGVVLWSGIESRAVNGAGPRSVRRPAIEIGSPWAVLLEF